MVRGLIHGKPYEGKTTELRSCAKVEVAVLGHVYVVSLIVLMVSVDVKQQ